MTTSNLENRIKDQFPGLFITLVTVLIGLVLADLVSVARARMELWPLNLMTLRTWAQLSTNGLSALVAWVTYAHFGISRRHIPTLADAIIAFSIPSVLLMGTSFVGLKDAWPWFYFAAVFLLFSLVTPIWHVRLLREEGDELESFALLLRPTGYLSVFITGIPFFVVAGWLDQHHMMSPLFEFLCAASGPPSACMVCHLFLVDWRKAVDASIAATAPELEPAEAVE
jgi:hypothetical protein